MSKNRRSNRPANQGFTLLEILVAIAIFASLSLSAYMVLNQVQRSNQLSLEKTERLKDIQRSMVIIDNDFRQIALRQFRTNGEEAAENLLFFGDGLLESDENAVLFTRLGWQNPQQIFPRGEVTKVGYRIVDSQLERVWWRYPDTPSGQEGIVTPLISGVEKMDAKFYKDGSWVTSWDEPLTLPRAIVMTFTLYDYGDIERVYLTAGESLQKESSESDG